MGKKKEFDLEQVESLAALQCTLEEMGSVLKCSVDTIERRMKDTPAFAEAIKRGKDEGKTSLRRMQWKSAEGGNVTMQIWLGKQYLGQSDKQEVDTTITSREKIEKEAREVEDAFEAVVKAEQILRECGIDPGTGEMTAPADPLPY